MTSASAASSSENEWTGLISSDEELLSVLAQPEAFGLRENVWLALNASTKLVTTRAEHTLAGRLRLLPAQLERLARGARLFGGKGLRPQTGEWRSSFQRG